MISKVDQGMRMPPPSRPMTVPLQFKRGTARAFRINNPILLKGEPAFETDTMLLKVGNGKSRYKELPYIGDHSKPKDGKSAYELWLEQGYYGTIDDFLTSLIGEPGKSAYEIWLSLGNEGTIVDFIDSLHGVKGEQGYSAYDSWIQEGHSGTVAEFLESLKGQSAYQLWLALGHEGTEDEFIKSLKGEQGYSAYEVWLKQGHIGTIDDYFAFIKGEKGDKGDKGEQGYSAYEIWLQQGNRGTEADFLRSLQFNSIYEVWKQEQISQGKPYDFNYFVSDMTTSTWEPF